MMFRIRNISSIWKAVKEINKKEKKSEKERYQTMAYYQYDLFCSILGGDRDYIKMHGVRLFVHIIKEMDLNGISQEDFIKEVEHQLKLEEK